MIAAQTLRVFRKGKSLHTFPDHALSSVHPLNQPRDAACFSWYVMDEHRISPRHRVLKAGTIEFSGGVLPCTVRNLSDSGAAIEVNSPLWFPDRFVLAIASEGWRRPCRVIRRNQRRIGVAFEKA